VKEKAAIQNQQAKEVVNRISEIRNTPVKKNRSIDYNLEESSNNHEFDNIQPRSKLLIKRLKKIRQNLSALSKEANIIAKLMAEPIAPNKKFTMISGDILRAIDNSGVNLEVFSVSGGMLWKFESVTKQSSFCKKLENGLDTMKTHFENNVS
jgi:hypothetical protein